MHHKRKNFKRSRWPKRFGLKESYVEQLVVAVQNLCLESGALQSQSPFLLRSTRNKDMLSPAVPEFAENKILTEPSRIWK